MFLIPPVITHASSIGMTFMTKWQSFEEEIIIVLIYFMVPTVPGAVMGNSLCNLTPKTTYCCCSVAQSCLTLCDTMDGSMPGFSALHSLLGFVKSTFMESLMLTNYFIFNRSLLLLSSIFPSISVFSNELAIPIRCPQD